MISTSSQKQTDQSILKWPVIMQLCNSFRLQHNSKEGTFNFFILPSTKITKYVSRQNNSVNKSKNGIDCICFYQIWMPLQLVNNLAFLRSDLNRKQNLKINVLETHKWECDVHFDYTTFWMSDDNNTLQYHIM